MQSRIINRRDHPQTIHCEAAHLPPESSHWRDSCRPWQLGADAHACARPPAAGGGVSLFNGKDLSGWEGAPGWWTVEDGALTAQSTPEKPCKECNYLVWKGGKPADFELTCDFKLSAVREFRRPDPLRDPAQLGYLWLSGGHDGRRRPGRVMSIITSAG